MTTIKQINTLYPNFEIIGVTSYQVLHKPTGYKSIDLGKDLWDVLCFISKLDEDNLLKSPYHLWFESIP